jgi:hypothetical protein
MRAHIEQLQSDAERASAEWRDEQDRSDWFEEQARYYAALADELQSKLDQARR